MEHGTRSCFGFSGAPPNHATPTNGNGESVSSGDAEAAGTVPAADGASDGTHDAQPVSKRRNVAQPDTIQLFNVRGLANNSEPRNI